MSVYGQMMKGMSLVGRSIVKKLDKMTQDTQAIQNELLLSVLRQNQDTEFGKENGFAEINNVEDYQKRVKIREYDEFAPYIERMVRGEENILTAEHINHYNKTSGTLGCEKYIPLAKKQIGVCGKYHALYANGLIASHLGYRWNNGKGINLQEGNAKVLPSGATYGCASSVAVKNGPFKNLSSGIYTSPIEAKQPRPGVVTRYIHARFALAERKVTYIISTFSSIMLEMFRYIEDHHEMLARDIELGTIDESVELPDEVRASLLEKIKPDPKRAEELRAVFARGFESPWATLLWPKLQYIYSAAGANFSPYTEKLKKSILGNSVHVFYMGVSASEGLFSVPCGMDDPDSVLVPDGCFMEFRDAEDENAPCLTADRLEAGKCYELIITNYSGLYRYRMHDVVRVTGYRNSAPLIQFETRAGFAANIRGEKTSEVAVRKMIEEAEKTLGIEITDYSLYEDVDATPPGYVILLELRRRPQGVSDQDIAQCLKEKLAAANQNLIKKFESGDIADPLLLFLQPETYLLYRDLMIHKGVAAAQLKPVHVIRSEFQRRFFFALQEEPEGKAALD